MSEKVTLEDIKRLHEEIGVKPKLAKKDYTQIKTIKSNSNEEFDALVNEFSSTHKVFATQTHVTMAEGFSVYVAVLFWKE